MSRRVVIVVAIVIVLLVTVGLLIPFLIESRLSANRLASQNNLRELSLFAAHHAQPDPKRDPSKLPRDVPAATIFLKDVAPDDRLSWAVGVLPGLDQKRQNTEPLLQLIDPRQPWSADPNQRAARTRVIALICPENPPVMSPDLPALTCYVGIAGVGPDAATRAPNAPGAGAFRYDGPTSFDHITDGNGQTLLFAETRNDPGPWSRGGYSTTRGLDPGPDAKPLVGGQFGGYFPNGVNFALCDGSVRFISPKVTPEVLLRMATIAGGDTGPIPGE
jgi:prepilin-type processing-associated H-X9-DG protein